MKFLRGYLLCAMLFYFAIGLSGLLIYFDNNFVADRRCCIFHSSVLYLFYFIYMFLCWEEIFDLRQVHLTITAFTDRNFIVLHSPAWLTTEPMGSSVCSRVFMVSVLSGRTSVHFEYRIRWALGTSFCMCTLCFPNIIIKDNPFKTRRTL